ncbi:type II toxin-antitoxin system PemK/MazF family toxin [Niveispirillum irakense]|uniref:type II toxin-antitoxin system PemK/MazF family toxin n=1 Tax=Niveispirillum irakense TaxID=34011 RepID=UPI00041990ED|nr:type II toxin-antitoxin system PemK/MazF family toxin [Niveispirillum irakense]
MQRGDVVVVATNGDYGKPRPAVILQSDALPPAHQSVVIVQFTSDLAVADFRVTIEPNADNGLRSRSQLMADKPVTVRRDRIQQVIGHLSRDEMAELTRAVAFVIGLADA